MDKEKIGYVKGDFFFVRQEMSEHLAVGRSGALKVDKSKSTNFRSPFCRARKRDIPGRYNDY